MKYIDTLFLYITGTVFPIYRGLFWLKHKLIILHDQSLFLSPLLLIFQPNHYVEKYLIGETNNTENLISFLSAKRLDGKTLYSCYTLCSESVQLTTIIIL